MDRPLRTPHALPTRSVTMASETTAPPTSRRHRVAAAFTAAAGAVHVAAAATHMGEGLPLGLGFLAIGWAQLHLAYRLARGTAGTRWLLATIGVHLAAVASWAVSRTVGLPLLHPAPEPIALSGVLTFVFELAAIAIAGWALARPTSASGRGPRVLGTIGAAWALVLVGSGAAVADLGTNGHGHGGGDASASHGEVGHGDEHDHDGEAADDDTTDDDTTTGHTATSDTTTSTSEPEPAPSPSATDDGHDHTHDDDHSHDA